MGVNLFGGRFRSCVDQGGNVVNYSVIAGEAECRNRSSEMNVTWKNPQINFDNVLSAYLALFQVVGDFSHRFPWTYLVYTNSLNITTTTALCPGLPG